MNIYLHHIHGEVSRCQSVYIIDNGPSSSPGMAFIVKVYKTNLDIGRNGYR